MSLDNKIAKGLCVAGLSLTSLVINPNFEVKDFKEPHRYVQKFDYRRGYPESGMVYSASAAALAGALVATAYLAMTKK